MVGRNAEIKKLNELYRSNRAELVAVYGRRRIGNYVKLYIMVR